MKEPRIMQMDWKALGYERTYINGRLRWIPRDGIPQILKQDTQDQDTSS
jgi:hypothetical protein